MPLQARYGDDRSTFANDALAVTNEAETRHYAYALRLVAFLLIIVGIVDKNRRARP